MICKESLYKTHATSLYAVRVYILQFPLLALCRLILSNNSSSLLLQKGIASVWCYSKTFENTNIARISCSDLISVSLAKMLKCFSIVKFDNSERWKQDIKILLSGLKSKCENSVYQLRPDITQTCIAKEKPIYVKSAVNYIFIEYSCLQHKHLKNL